MKRSRRRKTPPLPRGVRWLMFRRRIRHLFHGRRHHVDVTDGGGRRSTQSQGAQDIVEAARDRAQHIEQEAVEWAERLIASAQQRAAEIVSEAEERMEEMAARSSQLTRGYLRDVFYLLDAGLAREEEQKEEAPPPRVIHEAPARGPWERAPEGSARANLGIVPNANEGA